MVFLNICDSHACGNIITVVEESSQYCQHHNQKIGGVAPVGPLRSQEFSLNAGDGVFSHMPSKNLSGAGFKIFNRDVVVCEYCKQCIDAGNWNFQKSAWENHKIMNPHCAKVQESEGYFTSVHNRYASFQNPVNVTNHYFAININYKDLAEAGFFCWYSNNDLTQCYICGLLLNNWKNKEIPKIEHVRHNEHCLYVKTIIEPLLTQNEKSLLSEIKRSDIVEQKTKLLVTDIVKKSRQASMITQKSYDEIIVCLDTAGRTDAEIFASHLTSELESVVTCSSNVNEFKTKVVENILEISSKILADIKANSVLKAISDRKKTPFIEVIKAHKHYSDTLMRRSGSGSFAFGLYTIIPHNEKWNYTQQHLWIINNQEFIDISNKFTELLNQDLFTGNTQECKLARDIVQNHLRKNSMHLNEAYQLAVQYREMNAHSSHMCFIKFLHDFCVGASNSLPLQLGPGQGQSRPTQSEEQPMEQSKA